MKALVEMNKIIKGKTHYYENDTLTTGTFKIGETGTFPNYTTTTYYPSRVYDAEEIENIINENTKLKQDKQELIEWLKEEMKALNPKKLAIGVLNLRSNDIEFFSYFQLKQILEKLGE